MSAVDSGSGAQSDGVVDTGGVLLPIDPVAHMFELETRRRDWLVAQIAAAKAARLRLQAVITEADSPLAPSSGPAADEEESLQLAIQQAQAALSEAAASQAQTEMLRERLELAPAALAAACAPATDLQHAVKRAMDERDELACRALQLSDELERVTDRRIKVEAEAQALRREVRDVWSSIEARDARPVIQRPPTVSVATSRLEERVEALRKENAILRHVTLGIVAESQADWAADATLREAVLALEAEPGVPTSRAGRDDDAA